MLKLYRVPQIRFTTDLPASISSSQVSTQASTRGNGASVGGRARAGAKEKDGEKSWEMSDITYTRGDAAMARARRPATLLDTQLESIDSELDIDAVVALN